MSGSQKLSRLTADDVLPILKSFRCRYQQYSGERDGMLLMDVLAPADDRTVERGEEEIERLASYIAAELSELAVPESTELRQCNSPFTPAR